MMDKKKLRHWVLAGVLANLLLIGLFGLHTFPFQILGMRRMTWERNKAEILHLELGMAPEMGAQMEEGITALEESLARFPYIHHFDPTPFLLPGLEEASRIARAEVEKIEPLAPSPEEEKRVTRLSWRVTVEAGSYANLKRFFTALEPLPFLVSGAGFSLTVAENQRSQAQFIIFTFLGE